jgi:hypothetical protein
MTILAKPGSNLRRAIGDGVTQNSPFHFERPPKDAILDPNVAELARKLEQMLASGKMQTSEIERILERITSRPGSTPRIFDKVVVLASRLSNQPSLVALLLNGL